MNRLTHVNRIVITAVCMALCPLLPLAIHGIPNAGVLFSPMHIPVLLCGLICGWHYGLLCGIIGPFLSTLVCGMPVMANLPFMMIELGVYGLLSGLLFSKLHSKHLVKDIYISLGAAMLTGRIVAGIAKALLLTEGSFSFRTWLSAYFISGFPGIIIHLILVPVLYAALQHAQVIPAKYPANKKAA